MGLRAYDQRLDAKTSCNVSRQEPSNAFPQILVNRFLRPSVSSALIMLQKTCGPSLSISRPTSTHMTAPSGRRQRGLARNGVRSNKISRENSAILSHSGNSSRPTLRPSVNFDRTSFETISCGWCGSKHPRDGSAIKSRNVTVDQNEKSKKVRSNHA